MRSLFLTGITVAVAALSSVGNAQEPAVPPGAVPQGACCDGACRDPNLSCVQNAAGWFCDQFRSMPQTCYSPSFGCYPGNGRDIQRYPAFHGSYYRRAYNYRQTFEWPWLADPHQPLPLSGPYVAGGPMAMQAISHPSPFIEEPASGAELVPRPPVARPPLPPPPAVKPN